MNCSRPYTDDAISYLRDKGYKAEWKDGTAVVYLDIEDYRAKSGKTLKMLRVQLEEIGYYGSIGVSPSARA